jgi:2'-5' RNA ligase
MIRSFVAIDLPDTAKDALLELGQQLRHKAPDRSVRWSRVSGIHLTLKFLGDVSEDSLPGIKAVLGRVAQHHAPFRCTIEGVGCFPNTRSPRVVWAGVREESGRLLALQRDVENDLTPLGFKPEKRPYHPHLTLGRTARHVRSADQRTLGDVIAGSDVGELAQLQVESFLLMRSDLRPDGAVYTPLGTFPLSAA